MAKPGKKKSGFHKDIASVLKGVPIPQGVRNWRPLDESDTERMEDSLTSKMTKVSSVFKGVVSEPDCVNTKPAEPQSHKNNTKNTCSDTNDEYQPSRSSLITKLDCPDDSQVQGMKAEKSKPVNKVVCYRDPLMEKAVPSSGRQEDGSLILKKALCNKKRKALALSAPILIIIIILIHKYCFHSAPQESEASASNGPPLVSTPSVSMADMKNDVDWQVPELLPERVMDFLKDPEEETEQNDKTADKEKEEIDLRAILFSDQNSSAIIGGNILHVGDMINDVIITKINKDSVEFEKDGKTWSQKLRK